MEAGQEACNHSSIAALSYEASVRALDLQERAVDQLRSRAGIVLAATSITASFLGAQTIQHRDGFGVLEVGALLSLAASICLCVYVLLPKKGFVFSINGSRVYEEFYGVDVAEAHRQLTYWLEVYYSDNQVRIESLIGYLSAASLALVLQLVLWSWALAGNVH
jgi:hypothetical protein